MAKDFHAGETLTLDFDFSNYPASDGWAATFLLRTGSTVQRVTLAASGDSFGATVAATKTQDWPAGVHEAFVQVEKDGAKYIAHAREFTVRPRPDLEVSKTALELDLERVDEAITAILNGEGVAQYSITTAAGQRSIQRMDLADLRSHRKWLEQKIDAERVKLGRKPKNQQWRRIGARFVS